MVFLRPCVALLASIGLAAYTIAGAPGATPALGILTQAYQAHVDEALAFPGLSVFDGEELSTELQGRISVRVGHSVLTLAGNTSASVFHITDGIHVDLTAGSLYFNGASGEVAEMHVGEALLRTVSKQIARTGITVLAPNVLQVTAQKGGVNFSYREEFRYLPEGQTYRIYLDAPAEPQVDAVSQTARAGIAGKVAYFIMGTAAGGGAVWGIHEGVAAGNPPISPAKP